MVKIKFMIAFANPSLKIKKYKKEIIRAVNRTLETNSYILGPEVKKFEKNFSKYIGTKYSVGVANGTDAIEISLRSLNIGIGDEVITVSHTAVASVSAIISAGAKPVLVDIENEYLQIDISKVVKAITNKTKAVLAVHLYGQSVELDGLKRICKDKKILLIEDVSQAHGAKYKEKKLGSHGIIGCFSCYPTKNLGALGDAGILTTNNKKIYKKMKLLREYGWKTKFYSEIHGRNSRIDEIQAAILNIKIKYLDKENKNREDIASLYKNFLDKKKFTIVKNRQNSSHVYHLFVVKVKKRKKLLDYLRKKKIATGIHYPYPVHLQKGYKKLIKTNGALSITEKNCKNIISLPIYPELKKKTVIKIIKNLNNFN